MAHLSSSSARPLAQHLADQTLTPIVSTSISSADETSPDSQSIVRLQAFSSLTFTAITAFESASRLGLGTPQRIMIETQRGPVVLHSFIVPQSIRERPRDTRPGTRGIIEQAREDLRPLSGTTEGDSISYEPGSREALVNGTTVGLGSDNEADDVDESDTIKRQPPMLIASVIAPSTAALGNAKKAATGLERIGREVQREWAKEQEESQGAMGDDDDG